MQKRIEVEQAAQKSDRLVLSVKESTGLNGFKPAGRMLADSDNLAFIYIVESDGEYHYVSIPSTWWKDLKVAYDDHLPVILESGGTELTLEDIHNELSYLIENIEGNANYGEEMEREVVGAFGKEE